MIGQSQPTAQEIKQRLEEEALGAPALLKQEATKAIINYFADNLAQQYATVQLQKQDLYSNLLKRLFPEVLGRALPAYALAQLSVSSQVEFLETKDQFQIEGTDLYFSPIVNTNLIGAELCFVLSKQATYYYEKGATKFFEGNCPYILHPGGLMLGIRLKPKVSHIDGLTLSIDGIAQSKINFLPFVQMDTAYDQLELRSGFIEEATSPQSFPDREFFRLKSIQANILAELGKSVFTIHMKEGADLSLLKNSDPQLNGFLNEQFAVKDLDELIWLSFHYPAPFTAEDLAQCSIHLNTVPMWNVRKDISADQVATSNTMLVPLHSTNQERKEYFLGLEQVKTDTGHFVHSPIKSDLVHTYNIQERDISDFGSAAIKRYIRDLIFMIEQEKNKIGQLKQEEFLLIHPLEQLSAIVQQLEEQIINYGGDLSAHSECYLHLFPKHLGEMVYIESLHTQGDQVGRRILPKQAPLLPSDNLGFSFESAFLLDQPQGGRAPLELREKEDLIKTILSQQAGLKI